MIWNYIKIALRMFRRQKAYAFINVAGLALGMACCVVLFLFIQHEWSFDRFHRYAERIYRVVLRSEYEGRVRDHAGVAAPLAPAWKQEIAGIESAVRFGKNTYLVKYRDKRFYEKIVFADPEIFDIFDFPLLEGNPRTALSAPDSLLISDSMREKYFGTEDALGKTLLLDDRLYRISGILRDIPSNSHLQFGFLGSFSRFDRSYAGRWGVSNFATYFLVQKDFSLDEYALRMPSLVEKYRGKEARYSYGITYPLEPLTRIHLYSEAPWDLGPEGHIQHLAVFSAVALFILLVACFNTINLSTARSLTRAREVGLRKVIGAGRRQLALQFLGESFLMTAFSLLMSAVLVEMLLPIFNRLSGKTLHPNYLHNFPLAAFLAGVFLFVGFLSGGFLAIYVSGFQPVKILKGPFRDVSRVPLFRKIVIVGQFAVSILFIAATLIIFNQLRYMRTKSLGYNREHVVSLPIFDKEIFENQDAIKAEFLRDTGVISVSASSYTPGSTLWHQSYRYEGMPEDMNPMIRWIAVDHDFVDTLELNILLGRNFSSAYPTDAGGAYILNQSAVRAMGWDLPLGKRMEIVAEGSVVGVIQDFHFRSLHHPIEPLALHIWPAGYDNFLVRIRSRDIPRILEHLKEAWESFSPDQAFSYIFLDEAYDNLYRTEMRLNRIFGHVTAISLFIACLGLFGLAAFSTERRTKEIGIRKVLGASIPGVAWLLSREFTRWVLLANLIAWPAAFGIMQSWLGRFAYRISIGIFTFLLAGLSALLVSLLTIAYHAVKAAFADPVESLRYE